MKTSFTLALCLLVHTTFAQLIQMNQTPLKYNPSFAGNMGGGRLAYASSYSRNVYNSNFRTVYGSYSQATNVLTSLINHLSYDDLWKKKGIGWGIDMGTESKIYNEEYKRAYNDPNRFYKDPSFHLRNDHQAFVRAIIAPKYVLKDQNGNNTHTLSPSLQIGYSYFNQSSPYYLSYYTYPGQSISAPYLSTYAYKAKHTFDATLGLLLNSKKGFVGIAIKHTTISFPLQERHIRYNGQDSLGYYSYTYSMGEVQSKNKKISYPTFSVILGKTFQFRQGAKFSFTPQLYVGYSSYKRRQPFTDPSNGIALNLHFTWDKWFLGTGIDTRVETRRNVFGGYQNQRYRVGVTYSWGEPYVEAAGAISFTYYFKKGE